MFHEAAKHSSFVLPHNNSAIVLIVLFIVLLRFNSK